MGTCTGFGGIVDNYKNNQTNSDLTWGEYKAKMEATPTVLSVTGSWKESGGR